MDEPADNDGTQPQENSRRRRRLAGLWRALRYRNDHLFFIGQSISLIGTWLTRLATAWLVYRLTGSEWMLGLVGFASQIRMFILAPFAGVWVDRWNRHRILVVTQVLSMLQSFALAALTLAHVINVMQIMWLSVLQGLINAFGFPPIRAILLLLATVSLLGMSYTVLMPVFAKEVLGGNSTTLGWLMAASGIGALIGALYLASRRTVLGLGKVIAIMAGVFGAALVGFGFSHFLWLSLLTVFIAGFAMITHFASANTILQTIVEDDKRGRVMSLFGMAFMGMAPFGSLVAGAVAERIGPGRTVVATGLACIAVGFVFATRLPRLRKSVHPIYVRRGIIPQVAQGLQTASYGKMPPEE